MTEQLDAAVEAVTELVSGMDTVSLSASDWEMVELAVGKDSLAEKPGKNNWIEKTSDFGLPKYIAEIAKALIRDHGFTKSRAIATAISRVKMWAATSKNAKTKAKAAAAVAEWESLKARNKARKAVK